MDEKKYKNPSLRSGTLRFSASPAVLDPAKIEKKWQEVWQKQKLYKTPDLRSKDKGLRTKKYILDMFPYPSGYGLHVGHIEGYTGTDIVSRYLRMKGFAVLHPMGWDAFGLPAENYAIKNGIPPDKSTHDNIANFTKQINRVGLSYDWEREIDSSSPNYYKYTQWIFTVLFKKGLAYKKKAAANWCPKDETVLANEQVIDGKCERCGTEVVQKELDQWFFKITDYADRLIDGLKQIDWPKSTKLQQENWIGRKEGIVIRHKVKGLRIELESFSAYPAWLWADSYIVLAPEHPQVSEIVAGTPSEKEVMDFVEKHKKISTSVKTKTKLDEKEGVFTGKYAIDPITGAEMPIWLANFALMEFGTGIIRCSAHDQRDVEFAKKYSIPLKQVVTLPDGSAADAHENKGILENSGPFTGREITKELISEMVQWFVKQGYGRKEVNYHLRDWLVSRQRYWGAPIPMIFCEKCGWQPVPDEQLPVLLPTDVDFKPIGESPIARSKTFQEGVRCPECGGSAKREVDTMDTFVDSSWYFWAFTFAHKELMRETALSKKGATDVFTKFKDEIRSWSPVDIYVGGAEHTVLHLMYARFFWKVFCDLGLIDKSLGQEPFLSLRHPGTVLGPDSRKMSKRWNNVVDPTDVSNQFGADTLRMYEMFMGPFETSKPWNPNSVAGVHRFLLRVFNLFNESFSRGELIVSEETIRALNKLISKVANDIENFKFNTGISAMMQFVNEFTVHSSQFTETGKGKSTVNDERGLTVKQVWKQFLIVLAPFAPHLAEELWQELAEKKDKFSSIHEQSWPKTDNKYLADESATIAVSINGKTRGTIEMRNEKGEMRMTQKELEKMARNEPNVAKYLEGKEVKKVIYVPGKIFNFVI